MNSNAAFFEWLATHEAARKVVPFRQLFSREARPDGCAIVAVDMIKGFCERGPLASEAVGSLVEPIRDFLLSAREHGVGPIFFPCDAHSPESPEFEAFPPHCLAGSEESQLVGALAELKLSPAGQRLDKGSVSSLFGTGLLEKLKESDVHTIVCVGDCTDLCLYHLAVGLRYYANQEGLKWEVVVPAELVATYDLPVETALEVGALPHPGRLLHSIFLYHLELNGVRVVRRVGFSD